MLKSKWLSAVALCALMATGAAHAQKKVVAVSIPAATHGWTAGVVYHAQAAAKALLDNSDLDARAIVEKALGIAGDICIYTNHNVTIEEL